MLVRVVLSKQLLALKVQVTYLGASQIASGCSEALSKGSHENVHIVGVAAVILDDAPPRPSNGTYAMSLVQVQVSLVLLLQGYHFGQLYYRPLHAGKREEIRLPNYAIH